MVCQEGGDCLGLLKSVLSLRIEHIVKCIGILLGSRVDKVGGVGVPVVKQDDRNGHSLAGQGAYGLVIGIHHRLVEVVGHPVIIIGDAGTHDL